MLKSLLLATLAACHSYQNTLLLCEGVWSQVPFPLHSAALKVEIAPATSTGSLTVALYAFEDRNLFEDTYSICYQEQVAQNQCSTSDMNKFIVRNSSLPSTPFLNEGVHWHTSNVKRQEVAENSLNSSQVQKPESLPSIHDSSDSSPLSFVYNVTRTGYYCIIAIPDPSVSFQDYSIQFYVQNPYGALPAVFYPAMPFFATQLAAYCLLGIVWAVVSFVNRRELLRMQNLIGFMILFLILENCVNLSFFIDFNNKGYISKTFLGAMVALNAGRNSFSFFLLLVTCLGYGVVYPSLGAKMFWAVGLTVVHFIFGALYFTYSMLQRDANSFLVFILGLPLAATLFIFYVSILLGISSTVMHLEICLLFAIFVANGLNMFFRHTPYWTANQWKWRWLLLDGALNTNYFVAFTAISYLWMPTRNNGRLALEQIGSEDIDDIPGHDFEEFEDKDFSENPFKFGMETDFSASFLEVDDDEIEDLQ